MSGKKTTEKASEEEKTKEYIDGKLTFLLRNRTPYDDMDLRILLCLKRNSRISNSSLSRELGVNEVTITRRIQNLWNRGLIRCACTLVNYQRLGLTLKTVMTLKVAPDALESVAKKIQKDEHLLNQHRILDPYKEHNLICELIFPDMAELQEFFDKVSHYKGVKEYEYYILTKPFKSDIHQRL